MMDIKDVFSAAAELAKEAGDLSSQRLLMKTTPHWLRHHFVSVFANNASALNIVMDVAGHKNINTTATWHIEYEQAAADMRRLQYKF